MSDPREKVILFLEEKNVPYETIEKEKILSLATKEEKNAFWSRAVKTLICYDKKDNIHIFMLPMNENLHQNKARKLIESNKMRFVSAKILTEEFGLTIGAISPLQLLDKGSMYMDQNLNKHESLTISSGILDSGIKIKKDDLLRLTDPTFGDIT